MSNTFLGKLNNIKYELALEDLAELMKRQLTFFQALFISKVPFFHKKIIHMINPHHSLVESRAASFKKFNQWLRIKTLSIWSKSLMKINARAGK